MQSGCFAPGTRVSPQAAQRKRQGPQRGFPTLPFQRQKTRHHAGSLAAESETAKGKLGDPVAAKWYSSTTASDLQQPDDAGQTCWTKLTPHSTSEGQNDGVSKG